MEALQAQVTAMREERDQAVQNPAVKRQAVGHVPPRNNGVIPPMPTLVPAELDNWMQDLQQELQNAMTIGDQRRVVEVSTKLAEGASQIGLFDGRCGQVTVQAGRLMRTSSRYGLRGVRLGEASILDH